MPEQPTDQENDGPTIITPAGLTYGERGEDYESANGVTPGNGPGGENEFSEILRRGDEAVKNNGVTQFDQSETDPDAGE